MKAEIHNRKAKLVVLVSRDLTDRRRTGMTLFEVMLVMILLVVMGSLAKPALEGTLASYRLQRGADQVLADWAKVRTRAIEDGQVYQFRFSENSNEYRVDPWYADESYQPSQADAEESDFPSTREFDSSENEQDIDWQFQAKIFETLEFVGGQQATVTAAGEREVETLESEDSAEWSAPILFFPDGTTSEASLLLRNDKDRYLRIMLRALTGSGRGSALLTAGDVDEQESR